METCFQWRILLLKKILQFLDQFLLVLQLYQIFFTTFFSFLNMHIAKPKAGILWGTETSKQRLFLAPQQVKKKNITSPLEILQEGKAESSTSAIAVAAVEEINDLNWWMELMPRSQCVPSALQVLVQSLFWGTNFKSDSKLAICTPLPFCLQPHFAPIF